MFISLKPPEERAGITTAQVIDRLRRQIFAVPGIRLFMFAAQDVRTGGRQSDSNYQYTLSSTDLDLLQKWAPIVPSGWRRSTASPMSPRTAIPAVCN